MARRISDEEIKLSIIIDGNPAQKAILDLEKDTINYKRELAALEKQQKALQRQRKTDTDEYRANAAEIRRLTTAIDTNEAKLKELTSALKLSDMTMAQLRSKAQLLQATLRHLVPGTEDFERYNAELAQVNTRMDELRGHGQRAGFSVGALADRFNRYAALGASVVAAGTGIVLSIQKILDFNSKLSDSQVNVMKTTGMTRQEVDELSKSFGALKTRTGRIELLGIAEIGGRLGIAKEEIQDFVKVMDKSVVALGDSFEGGPDVVAEKLGRIKGLYDELRDVGVEQAFEGVGSALNDLGADGTASEQNLAEFAQRVGSMPAAIKPTIQEALGLGAAFEESGLKAELAGNNYSKVITIAARDYKQFATIMRRPAEEIKNLINTNPTEFFFQFAQSLKGLDATDLAKVLDYLKLNDNEVKMVLGAASQNVDLFRDKIALANDSMADATSLTTEYDLKNNNLAATLDRLKKKVIGWFTSDSVVAFLEAAVNGLARLIGAVEDSDGTMNMLKNTLVNTAKILAVLIASILSYNAGVKLATVWSNSMSAATAYSNIVFRVQYALLVAQEIATKALALAKALLTLNITRARAAYQALAVAMGVNPFGALLAVLGAVVAAFVVFRKEADATSKIIQAQSEVMKTIADQTAKTKEKITDLVAVLRDENATYEQKQSALEQLQKIGKGYLDDLTTENILTAEGTRLINRYIGSINQLAKAKALVNVRSKLEEQKLESDNKILALSLEKKANTNEGSGFWGGDDGKFFGLGSRNKIEIQDEMNEEKEARKLKEKQLEAIDKQRSGEINRLRNNIRQDTNILKGLKKDSQKFKELTQDIKSDQDSLNILLGLTDANEPTETPSKINVPDGKADKAADKARKKAEAEHKKRMEDLKKQQQELTDLEKRAIDERLDLLFDANNKEEAVENENHRRKLEDLEKQLISEAAIEKALDKTLDPKSSKRDVDYWSRQMQTWMDKNKHLHTLIELEQARHRLALETIDLKAEQKRITDLQEKFDAETIYRQTNHNYEMAALGDNTIAKEKLQNKFDQEEIDRQKVHLETLVREKQDILGKMNNLDIELLSPEQRKQMEQEIDALKLKISELLKAKSELQGKNGSNEFGTAVQNVFGDADILGFTEDQWEKTFASLDTLEQKLQALNMVVGGLQNLWASYNSFVAAGEDAQLSKYEKNSDAKKRKLKQQLDNGYINQAQYKKGLEQLDADLELKKAEIEYKQAKRQKAMAIVDATINTAKGITAAIPNVVLMGIAAAAGALQIATIARQPLPARGYEEGLYPEYVKREQDGKVFKSTFGGKTRSGMVNRPTHFLAGENGPEMIIDAAAYRQMSPETKELLIRELRGIKGFEKGYYNNDVTAPRYEVPAATPAATNSGREEYLIAVIERNTRAMEKLANDGVVAFFNKDPRDIKSFMDDMDRIKQSKEKARN